MLTQLMRQIAASAVSAAQTELLFGVVQSVSPLSVLVDQRFTLPEEALLIPQELEESLLRVQHPMVEEPDLDRTYRIVTPLAVGEQVILLAAGGQYLILGRIGVPGRIRHIEEV